MDIVAGSADQSVAFAAWNADGTPATITSATAGLALWYRRGSTGAKTAITPSDLATLATAHADGGILVIAGQEHRLDLPDAAVAAGVDHVQWGGEATDITIDGGQANLTGQSGTGPRTITATVDDGDGANLENATIRLSQNGLIKAEATTDDTANPDANATLNVADGTYTVAITCDGYTYAGASLVVDGDETPTWSMTQVASTPPDSPDESIVTITCYGDTDDSGDHTQVEAGMTVQIRCTAPPTDDTSHTFDASVHTYTTDVNGQVELTLWRNASYAWRRGETGRWATFTPDAANYSVDSIVGNDDT